MNWTHTSTAAVAAKKSGAPNTAKIRKTVINVIVHIFLAILAFIWVLPIFWVILTSFRGEKGSYVSTFFPKTYTFNNYIKLFTDTSILNFPKIIGLFPSFMSMIAVYYILRALNLADGAMIRVALIIVFSAGSGAGFYVAKGFFDTISKSLDEAAIIDGATRWNVFTKITVPLSKPIIVYTILTSFMGPWVDFIFGKVICRADAQYYTVSIGLWKMLEKEYIDSWYTCFAAGAVVVSIPIAILFLMTQKFYVEGMTGAVKG